MSAPSSKPSQPTPTTFNERLNEQLINCLNIQTNVIQNLAPYSQHISMQLFEIKNMVEILSNRVLALQQQQQQQSHFAPNPYAASYYPNYMPHQSIPVSHPQQPPPSASHPPPIPSAVHPQSTRMHMSTMTTTAPSSNLPFFSQTTTNLPASMPSSVPSFQFSSSSAAAAQPPATSSQTNMLNTLPPTTTTPTKSIFSNPPKFSMSDMVTKPPLFPATTPTTTTMTATTNKNTDEKPFGNTPFKFGTNNPSALFGMGNLSSTLSTISSTKPETNADDDAEGGAEEEPYEPDVSFKPIVQLSAVEVKTGEEDENVLFCERAKLYRFDTATNQMKERGVGEMKILQHKTTKVCRILMRREQVLKLCANHQITSQMSLKPHQGSANAYLWSAMDFADGEAKHETFCIRFKTEEQAKSFAKVFNDAKETNAKKSGDLPSIGKISLNDETKATANDDDIISIGEVKPSAEQIDRAKQLQLPSTFFLYENKEPCKGCVGCKEDTPSIASNENKTTTKTHVDVSKNDSKATAPQTPSTPSTASAPKTPLSSSENIKFSFINPDQSQLQKQISTTKEEKSTIESPSSTSNAATSQYDNKPSIFGGFNGSSSIFGGSTPSNNTSNSVFGGGPSLKPSNNTNGGFSFPGFGNATTTTGAGFQFSTPSGASTTTTTTTTAADTNPTFTFGSTATSTATTTTTANTSSTFSFGSTNKPVFGNATKFSFSDLAKQSSSTNADKPTTNGTEQRVFAGQGSLVFGTNIKNTTTTENNREDEDGEGGGDDESYEPNVSFKPIVQLSAVEVKTGEEDENVLFCERAKLYRFDAEANQMKERGVGEMKILQHKTTKVCRILMRREQVLKLCANHQITSQMLMKPHQGSENAYVWSAMDFAEGEAKHETLCIRFKSSEVAKRFVQQFNDAKQENANAQQ